MELYDMAKMIAANEKPMDPIIFNQTIIGIASDVAKYKYLMLLCHERRDFTVFHMGNNINEQKLLAKDLSDTIINRGSLLYADKQKDGAWEIWIRDTETNENFAYFLFDYTNAIVEVGADE